MYYNKSGKPNIIFFFTDQQRADTCGCFGQKEMITPNLDKMAKEGVLFEQAYTPQPVCGPCRAIFQTGRYATDLGCYRNNIMLPAGVKTLADYLNEGGYETGYVGKWHLASNGDFGLKPEIDNKTRPVPQELRGGYNGFWRTADVLEMTSHGYDGYIFDENNTKIDFKGYRADCITDFALEFIDKWDGQKPFFLMISHIEPHHQNDHMHYEGPEGSKERFKNAELPEDLKQLEGDADKEYPDYLGACERLDYNFGRVIDSLKEKGIYDNTVIIYASDHGSHFKTRNKDCPLNGYDDYKRTGHAAATHVPLVICGGRYKGGRRISHLVSTESLPKTILHIAGIDDNGEMIGEDLYRTAFEPQKDRREEVFCQVSESRVGRCIRTPKYSYQICSPDRNGNIYSNAIDYVDDFMYDLQIDPYELNNVSEDKNYKEAKEVLREHLKKWIYEVEGLQVTIRDK